MYDACAPYSSIPTPRDTMNRNPALIASVAVLLFLGAAVWWSMSDEPVVQTWESDWELPILQGVSRIELQCSQGGWTAELIDGDWRLVQPVQANASDALMARIAETFAQRRVTDRHRPVDDPEVVAAMQQAVTLRVDSRTGSWAGRAADVGISAATPRPLTWFVPEGDALAHRTNIELLSRMPCDPHHMRDRRMVGMNALEVTSVTLFDGTSTVEFVRTPEGWTTDATLPAMEQSAIQRLVEGLATMSGARVVTAEEAGADAPSAEGAWYELKTESRTVRLSVGGLRRVRREQPAEASGAAGEGSAAPEMDVLTFLRTSDSEEIWQVEDRLAELLHTSLPELRVMEVLAIPAADLVAFEVTETNDEGASESWLVRRDACTGAACADAEWRLGDTPVDGQAFGRTLAVLSRVRASRWVTPAPPEVLTAFETPGRTLLISRGTGEVHRVELVTGLATTANGEPVLAAQCLLRVDGSDVFTVGSRACEALRVPRNRLVSAE
jgi:hypothetical protein